MSIVEKVNKSLKDNITGFQLKVGEAVAAQVLRRMVIHSKGRIKPILKRGAEKVSIVVPKTKDDPDGKKSREINREMKVVDKAIKDTLNPKILQALIKREIGG